MIASPGEGTATTAENAAARRGDDVSAGRVFARACGAEWLRLWTVKATWWFLAICTVVMLGLATLAGIDAALDADPPIDGVAWLVSSITTMPGQLALLALTLVAVTSDYGTGGIVPALQWTPRRPTFFAARVAVTVAVATALGVLLALGAAVLAWTIAHPVLRLPAGEGAEVLGTVAFVLAAGSALAAGLGFVLRNAAGGLVVGFLTMIVLPLFLPQFGYQWLTDVAQVLPGSAAVFLLLGEVPGMTTTSAAIVLPAWAGGALLLGWLRFTRTDVHH